MSHNSMSRVRHHRRMSFALLVAAALTCASLLFVGCQQQEDESSTARAYQSTHRTQLIGGPGALGEVGDYVIENDQIRLVIQDLTYNRGTGMFGGSLIDADLVRQDGEGNPFGGNGHDTFQEIFPIFLAEVIDPEEIVVVDPRTLQRDDVSDDAAVLEVRGYGGEFVTMARFFNQAMVNAYDAEDQLGDMFDGKLPDSDGEPLVEFTARYILEPGDRHARIEAEMTNIDDGTLTFPSDIVLGLADFIIEDMFGDDIDIAFEDFVVPTGAAVGFGAYNSVFMPGFGFDIRFGLEDSYRHNPVELPAIPGHITDIMASASNEGVSYGYATASDPENNFVYRQSDYYGDDVPDNNLLFVFEGAGFGATFTHGIPDELPPGDTFRTTNYFVVGDGDVASIRDEVYGLHEIETQTVTGQVFNGTTGEPVGDNADVLFYEANNGSCDEDDDPYIFNQTHTRADGYFEAELPVGELGPGYHYCHRARYKGDTGEFVGFRVEADEPTQLKVMAPGHGRVEAYVVDQTGNSIPAKMTITNEFMPRADQDPREFLFDLAAGERWRTAESVDLQHGETAEYIEMIEFSSADGRVATDIPPGRYNAYFSRGTEYELVQREIEVSPGDVTRLSIELERQINPDGYLTGDYHMHAKGSMDSALNYNDRVVSVAAEGVEVVVSSDHNYVSDYMPYIYRNNLQPFLRSIIGVELTTLEAGHFNAFPMRQDIASQSRGSVAWQNEPPAEIFDRLRQKGTLGPDDTIIQVNHPRDGILGYFGQHNVDPLTGEATLPTNDLGDGADGISRATAAATASSGPGFVEEYTDEDGHTQLRSAFSYDFDAIELFNGKRMHLLHHFRMPFSKDDLSDEEEQQWRDELGDEEFESLPDDEGVILCDGDDVAYPGGLDDWYNFLNYPRPDGTYRTYTATANSDSHHYGAPDDPEPGSPRNYFWAGHNNPAEATGQQLSQALQDHHNISTNGPFINISIDDAPVGSTVATNDRQVTLEVEVQAADWVIGDDGFTYNIIANGERIIEDVPVAASEFQDNRWDETHQIDLEDYDHIHHADDDIRDTWFIVELEGQNNLFPVIQPAEIPQIPFEEALGELAEPFGVGQTPGAFAPSETTDITPFAFTNPIWVVDDHNHEDRDEFVPPAPPEAECVDGQLQHAQVGELDSFIPFGERRLDAQTTKLDFHDHGPPELFQSEQGELRDVRMMFKHWHDH